MVTGIWKSVQKKSKNWVHLNFWNIRWEKCNEGFCSQLSLRSHKRKHGLNLKTDTVEVNADIHHWIASRGDTQTTHATILTDSRSLLQKKWNGKPRLARVNVPTFTFLKYPLSGWSLECDPSLLSRPINMGRTWTGPKRFSKKNKKKKRRKILLHSSVSVTHQRW